MHIDTKPLIDAIDKYIAKADDDLEETLASEGYVKAEDAVEAINVLEDAVSEALENDADEFLSRVQEAAGIDDFISDVWPTIKTSEDLKNALHDIFKTQFDDMLRKFTYNWILSEQPEFAPYIDDTRITKPAEEFIRKWSGDLADLMHLSTKDAMERILLKAQEKGWTIDEVSTAISDSGIRQVGYRSRRVAVTEVLRVESYAQQESMVQEPLTYGKKWKHVSSPHPRENHIAIDGQEVFKRETFTLTGADGVVYHPVCPRDTRLPAKETINCHCIMEAVSDANAKGISKDDWLQMRQAAMDEVDKEWEDRMRTEEALRYADESVIDDYYNQVFGSQGA